ncbi:MAG: hypothetical protein N2560_01650 [Ignavibacteria bacterium]|nr:hypothetical protein [Ignavibacteria bacterium]
MKNFLFIILKIFSKIYQFIPNVNDFRFLYFPTLRPFSTNKEMYANSWNANKLEYDYPASKNLNSYLIARKKFFAHQNNIERIAIMSLL